MRQRAVRARIRRLLDKNATAPKLSGGIVAHLIDVASDPSLQAQIVFLAERDVKTFRVYTNRPKHVGSIFRDDQSLRGLSHAVIDVSDGPQQQRLWKLVDSYNAGLPDDTWSLVLRAGELLAYPHFATRTLPDLCKFLFDEKRRSLFCLTLDLYPVTPSGAPLRSGDPGWAFDRFGYSHVHDKRLQLDRWRGGFPARFPDFQRSFGRKDLSRVPLIRIGRGSVHTRNLNHALPRQLNVINARVHLSPTGCILSSHAYRAFEAGGPWQTSREPMAKLVSAPHIEVDWRHHALAENGFMNLGQWL